MIDPNEPSRESQHLNEKPNGLEALERLRDSYHGLSARSVLTTADEAVRVAVGIALSRIARAG